jgi:glycerol-3-phosphate acyltransferase PlsY
VYRAAGMPAAILTVAGDIGKGWLAVFLAHRLVPGEWQVLAMSLAALAAILGHNRSIFLRGAGGAGSTPNIGALLFLDPPLFVLAFLFGAIGLFGIRIASVASLIASTTILVGVAFSVFTARGPYAQPALLVYGIGQLILVAWALRPNIARLRAGTERRITLGWRAPKADPPPEAGDAGEA